MHVADSLSGLGLLGAPARLADVGAGAGFPGLALAAALPETQVDLIESVGRKCAFIERAIDAGAARQRAVVCARAEDLGRAPPPDGGREAYDAVTARAVGRLATLAELASPLLRRGRRAGRLEGPPRPRRGGRARARRRAAGDVRRRRSRRVGAERRASSIATCT